MEAPSSKTSVRRSRNLRGHYAARSGLTQAQYLTISPNLDADTSPICRKRWCRTSTGSSTLRRYRATLRWGRVPPLRGRRFGIWNLPTHLRVSRPSIVCCSEGWVSFGTAVDDMLVRNTEGFCKQQQQQQCCRHHHYTTSTNSDNDNVGGDSSSFDGASNGFSTCLEPWYSLPAAAARWLWHGRWRSLPWRARCSGFSTPTRSCWRTSSGMGTSTSRRQPRQVLCWVWDRRLRLRKWFLDDLQASTPERTSK